MPEPDSVDIQTRGAKARRTALGALVFGALLMAMKLGIFAITGSTAVLSDALESLVNIAAAGVAMFSTWYASRPPDDDHPYGHGNVEFIAVAIEGMMVAGAGVTIAYEAMARLRNPVELQRLDTGAILLGGTALLLAVLAWWVWSRGKAINSPTLIADGKHLMTDVLTTLGVVGSLVVVQMTGYLWLDAAIALAVACVVMITGWRLMRQSWSGLTSQVDADEDAAIRAILDDELAAGRIRGYHKVRYRHVGTFHWIDMHIQMPGELTVRDSHRIASEIEYRIEKKLGHANATAHVEPA